MTTGSKSSAILKDVLAYVDVWSSSKTENYSKPFIQQLQEMGAEVSKTLNKQVTHVVFKNGRHSTWNKAKKMGVRLVSVLWVARCKDDGEHVDEELWPALNEEINPAIKNKAHRCMQPKDTPERTPENDRRMKKKLDKMIKDIVPKSSLITDVSPYIIDEVNGIVYSPSLKRADYMAQRLKDMKEKRENLSPTASQIRECGSSPGLRSSPRSTPPASILHLLDEDSEDDFSSPIGAHLPSTDQRDTAFQCEESDNNRGVKDLFDKPWLSPCGHVSRPKPSFHILNSDSQEDKKGTTSGKKSKGILVKSDEFSFDTGNGPDSSMNDQLETKSVSPTITKWGPLSRKSKVTNSKREKTGSMTHSQTKADQQVLNTRSCPLSATLIETTHVTKQVSEETCLPSLIVNKQINESSFPAQSSTVSNEPASLASHATTDENDDVFKDYFSPDQDHFRQQRPVLPSSLSKSTMQVPFDLEPNPGKRRRKTSQTPESESGHAKRKKHEEMHNVAHISQDSVSVNSISDPQEKPFGRKRSSRLVTMPVTSCSHLPAETTMQRALSNPAQPSKPSVVGACTTSYQQSDTGVISHHEGSEKKTSQNYENASRGTEYVAAGLSSNSSECKQVGVIEKSQDMDKKTKKCRTLVLTSMSTEKQQTVTQVVAALGGFSVVDQVCDSTTHVVSGGHRRTLNILLGIARGCWILSFEWILWCLEQRQWIPEEPYELSEHFPAAPICRLQQHLSAGEHQQDLFHGQPAMFVSHHSQPPTQSVVELIQLCGGTVCKTVRQAGICIGEYKGKRPEGCRILSEQWVLDCITRLQQLPYDSYTLE